MNIRRERDSLRAQIRRLSVSDTIVRDIDWLSDGEAVAIMAGIKRGAENSDTFVPELNRAAAAKTLATGTAT